MTPGRASSSLPRGGRDSRDRLFTPCRRMEGVTGKSPRGCMICRYSEMDCAFSCFVLVGFQNILAFFPHVGAIAAFYSANNVLVPCQTKLSPRQCVLFFVEGRYAAGLGLGGFDLCLTRQGKTASTWYPQCYCNIRSSIILADPGVDK